MNVILEFVIAAPLIIKLVFGVLSVLTALFSVIFVIRAACSVFLLKRLSTSLNAINGRKEQALELAFSINSTFSHLWKEYRDTLHEQQEFLPNGRLQATILRSTVPASMIFTNDVIVDTPLATEFFKHLPGIFTGVGIIGTFWELIEGLPAFQISDNPTVVRASLEELMHHVSSAFIVSAMAILLAMVTTFVERSLVTVLYGKVEEITARLDSFFRSGASEEYLARLTKASEETSAQSQLLKDALVEDLERILTTLAERQIEAQRVGTGALGQHLAEGIKDGLQKPLEDLAAGVRLNAEGNSEAVTQLLTDVLAGFSQKLQELFGGQISGINELQQKTIEALESAVGKLNQMASTIESTGAQTSEAMTDRLAAALTDMESHQKLMNERMAGFVEQLRGLVSQSQTETNQKLQAILADIGEAVRAQISALKEQGDRAAASHARRETQISERTQETLRLFGSRVDEILGSMKTQADKAAVSQIEREQQMTTLTTDTVAKLSSAAEALMGEVRAIAGEVRAAINAMREVTTEAVSKMNSGAETLYLAAAEFTTAGQTMSETLQQATGLTNWLQQAAGSVATASAALRGVVADHASARESLASMLGDLRGTVENAKKEANLTADILARIDSAAEKLGQAQTDADEYLDGISRILTQTHEQYATALNQTLNSANKSFYENLSTATKLLREAVMELEAAVEPVARRA